VAGAIADRGVGGLPVHDAEQSLAASYDRPVAALDLYRQRHKGVSQQQTVGGIKGRGEPTLGRKRTLRTVSSNNRAGRTLAGGMWYLTSSQATVNPQHLEALWSQQSPRQLRCLRHAKHGRGDKLGRPSAPGHIALAHAGIHMHVACVQQASKMRCWPLFSARRAHQRRCEEAATQVRRFSCEGKRTAMHASCQL